MICLLEPHISAVARHTAERYSYSKIFIAMAWLADLIGLPSGIGGLATTLLMDLPHSRKQEYEGSYPFFHCYLANVAHTADKIGLKLSAKACFNPTAAPECVLLLPLLLYERSCCLAACRMFKRLGALERSSGGLNVSFLNTHPASDERVRVCLTILIVRLIPAHLFGTAIRGPAT